MTEPAFFVSAMAHLQNGRIQSVSDGFRNADYSHVEVAAVEGGVSLVTDALPPVAIAVTRAVVRTVDGILEDQAY